VVGVQKGYTSGSVAYTFTSAFYKRGNASTGQSWYWPTPRVRDVSGQRWEWIDAGLHYNCTVVPIAGPWLWAAKYDWDEYEGIAVRVADDGDMCGGNDPLPVERRGGVISGRGANADCEGGGTDEPDGWDCRIEYFQLIVDESIVWEGYGTVCEPEEE